MSVSVVEFPFDLYTDAAGKPLDAGFVYVGVANADPVVSPVAVFWDAALTIPAAQPLRTTGGYISRNGAPANFFCASDYSIRVCDKTNTQIFYVAARADVAVTDITLESGESLIGEAGSSIDMLDGSTVNIGDGTGIGVNVEFASNARVVGELIPDTDGSQQLGLTTRRWFVNASGVRVEGDVLPQTAGGMNLGGDDFPAEETVTRTLRANSITAYRTAQPSSVTDYAGLAKLNARGTLLAACRQTSAVTPTLQPASATADGPYNVASITSRVDGTMLVVYKVTFTVPLPPDVKIVVMPETDFSAPDVTTPILDSRSYTGTSALSFVEFALCPINTAAGVQSPFTLLAYGSPSATGATGIVTPIL